MHLQHVRLKAPSVWLTCVLCDFPGAPSPDTKKGLRVTWAQLDRHAKMRLLTIPMTAAAQVENRIVGFGGGGFVARGVPD